MRRGKGVSEKQPPSTCEIRGPTAKWWVEGRCRRGKGGDLEKTLLGEVVSLGDCPRLDEMEPCEG